jgi:hypothetical protein
MSPPSANSGALKRLDLVEALVGIACGLSIVTALAYCIQIPIHPGGTRDYIVYWATGQQLVHHANPYDPNQMSSLEHSAGLSIPGSYFMRNPPWALVLTLPLGLAGAASAAIPWVLLLLAVLIASVRLIGPVVSAPGKRLALLGYSFPPALHCIIAGQTSLFVLLGLALFLRLHRTRPFWAGAGLWFCTLKPHVLLPFALVWLVWVCTSRAWRMLAGAAAALAASCVVTECIAPAAWVEYLQWVRTSGIAQEKIACIGVALRDLIHPSSNWIAWLPVAVASAWALVHFWRRRARWSWTEDGHVVVLASLLTAPYCWIWDDSVAIPAILCGANRTASRTLLAVLALAYVAIDWLELTGVNVRADIYLLPAVFWLAWYLAARALKSRSAADTSDVHALAVG